MGYFFQNRTGLNIRYNSKSCRTETLLESCQIQIYFFKSFKTCDTTSGLKPLVNLHLHDMSTYLLHLTKLQFKCSFWSTIYLLKHAIIHTFQLFILVTCHSKHKLFDLGIHLVPFFSCKANLIHLTIIK